MRNKHKEPPQNDITILWGKVSKNESALVSVIFLWLAEEIYITHTKLVSTH